MSLLIVIGLLLFWKAVFTAEKHQPKAPPIRDYDKLMKDSIGMDAKEIRKGLRQGRW